MKEKVRGKRTYKDALFKFIFGSEKHKKFTLDLYNAMNHTSYTDPSALEIVTLEQVVYIKMENDVAFLCGLELHLYEQQATWNPNVTFRYLEYVTGEYTKYVEHHHFNKYASVMFHLPAPHFVVFYNGTMDKPEVSEQYLHEMYEDGKEGDLDLKVTVYNINAGKNEELKRRCRPLLEYCWLTDTIKEKLEKADQKAEKLSRKEREKVLGEAISDALDDEMSDDFSIKEILMEEKKEVIGMLFEEYDERKAEQARIDYGEAMMAAGEKKGIIKGRAEGKAEGEAEERREGLKVVVEALKPFSESFEDLYGKVISFDHYKDASKEEVRKYYLSKN